MRSTGGDVVRRADRDSIKMVVGDEQVARKNWWGAEEAGLARESILVGLLVLRVQVVPVPALVPMRVAASPVRGTLPRPIAQEVGSEEDSCASGFLKLEQQDRVGAGSSVERRC